MSIDHSGLVFPPLGETVVIENHLPGAELALSIEPTHAAISVARVETRRFLDETDLDPAVAGDVELVSSELLANAVEQEPPGPIELLLRVERDGGHLTISNRNDDHDAVSFPDGPPVEILAERGWGLAIVAALVDGLWIHRNESLVSVTCRFC